MKILFVPYGTSQAPATRYRVTQYLPELIEAGINYRVFSSISGFSTKIMIKSPDFQMLGHLFYYVYVYIEKFFRLIRVIFLAKAFDVIFLQRTTFPSGLGYLLRKANGRIIFDIDDAIYLPDRKGNDLITRIKRYVKKKEVVNTIKIANTVIVENEYIKNFVSQYCERIYKIPGPIDTERFYVNTKDEDKNIVIGWTGSPATTPYLKMLDDIFREIAKKYNFVNFKFIGLGKYRNLDIKFERIPWGYETEVKELQTFDIGIMPMEDNEWTRGKLGCKMLQYMAVGIPSVVSYTPTNAEIIEDGENGFFVTKKEDWIKTLSKLIEDKKLRLQIGQKARETILKKCSLSGHMDYLIEILECVKNSQSWQ